MYFDVKTLTWSGFFYGLEIVVFNYIGTHSTQVVPTVFVVIIQQHISRIIHFAGQGLSCWFMGISAVVVAILALNEYPLFGRQVYEFAVAV